MEEKTELTYLGAVISNDRKNINNKNDQIKRPVKTNTRLGPSFATYTFVCGMSYINSMLSLAEAIYDIKEAVFRLWERREEENMKLLVETQKSVPLHLLYLDLGHLPARYLVKGNIVIYMHYLLQQKTGSMLFTFLSAQQKEPKRGGWFSYTQKVIIAL